MPGDKAKLLAEILASDKDVEGAKSAGDQQRLLVGLEKGLFLRRRIYAEASVEVSMACRRLCEACNFSATSLLQKENLKGAHELLKRAEQVADKSDQDKAITWNNLACYYRRIGKLRTAVNYLERALAIEEGFGSSDAAQTHLNLCATLSQLQRHSDALGHAQSALVRMFEVLTPALISGSLAPGPDGRPRVPESTLDQVTILCIAYHNLAVEYEHLKNLEAALRAYAEGVRWSSRFLAPGHQLIGILRSSMQSVEAKLPANSRGRQRAQGILDGSTGTSEDAALAPLGHLHLPSAADRPEVMELLTPRGAHEAKGVAKESSEEEPGVLEAGASRISALSESYSVRFSDEGEEAVPDSP